MILDNDGSDRLESPRNILNKLRKLDQKVVDNLRPKSESNTHTRVPDELKEVIGTIARVSGAQSAAAAFGVVPRTAYDYARGVTDGHHQYDTEMLGRIKEKANPIIETIRETALSKLMDSLGTITNEKLEACKALDASVIARNLAAVHEKLGDKAGVNVNGNVVFLVPRKNNVSDYEKVSA